MWPPNIRHLWLNAALSGSSVPLSALGSTDDHGDYFVIDSARKSAIPKLPVLACEDYMSASGCDDDYCSKLHLCRNHVTSQCNRGDNCNFNHDLSDKHNGRILNNWRIDPLSEDNILGMLVRFDPAFTPKVCKFFNVASGCTKKNCPFVHLCQFFVSGGCKFNGKCKKNHSLDQHSSVILKHHGISGPNALERFIEKSRKLGISEQQKKHSVESCDSSASGVRKPPALFTQKISPESRQTNEACCGSSVSGSKPRMENTCVEQRTDIICCHFLKGSCRVGNSCKFLHSDAPYQWQFKSESQTSWSSFDAAANHIFESRFCDVNQDEAEVDLSGTKMVIDFDGMKAKDHSITVRRCGTRQAIGSLGYNWFWKDGENWVNINAKSPDGSLASIDPVEIEKAYSEGVRDHIQNGISFLFDPMIIRSSDRQLFDIRRRPKDSSRPATSKVTLEKPKQESLTICSFNLRNKCENGSRCWNLHTADCFQWQIKDGEKWKNFDNEENMKLETSFSNPEIGEFKLNSIQQPVHLDALTGASNTGIEIRRLESDRAFATTWRWFWKENSSGQTEVWIEYGSEGKDTTTSSLSSADIESAFQEKKDVIQFTTNRFNYQIDLKKLVQRNMTTKVERKIRRRPALKTKQMRQEAISRRKEGIPSTWKTKSGYQSIKLSSDDPEFISVRKNFSRLITKSIEISRIENHSLWKLYSQKKQSLLEDLGEANLNELELFHGTGQDIAEKIIKENFDWRRAGENVGAAYGFGTYFTPNVSTALSYAKRGPHIYIFIAKVLVGKSIRGRQGLKYPPELPGGNGLYNSCVDREVNPEKYVIFDHNQIYPMYLVKLS